MGLNCTNPGGCHYPKKPCLASCSFTHSAETLARSAFCQRCKAMGRCRCVELADKVPFRQRKQYSLEDLDAAVAAERERCAALCASDFHCMRLGGEIAADIRKG